MSSDRERIIEFDAATTIPADGWFAIDSTTEGTRKVQKSAIIGSGTLDTTSQEVVGAINEVNARAATVESMTQAEYDALPDTKLSDNVVRYITDGEPTYDETLWNKVGEDPLDTTAQDCSGAINEIKSALSDLDLNVPHFKGMFDITTDLTSDKTYTATESCIVLLKTEGLNMTLYINAYVDGIGIGQTTAQGQTVNNIYAFLKKGSVLTLNASYPYNGTFHAYVV